MSRACKYTAFFLFLLTMSRGSAMLVLSQATNEMYIGVASFRAANDAVSSTNYFALTNSAPIGCDESLMILFFCRTGSVPILFPVNEGLLARISMLDEKGNVVPKTSEGRLWGAQVDKFPQRPGMNKFDRMASWQANLGPNRTGYKGLPSGPIIPAASKLFDIPGKGVYSLRIEVHIMKQHLEGQNNWTWDHVVMPPVITKVIKGS